MQTFTKESVIAVIGAGAMGAGIAQVAAAYGHRVKLYDLSPDAISQSVVKLKLGLDKQVARGKLTAAASVALIDRIHPVLDLADLADADLVIEAVVERLDVKREIFARLEEICSDKTIFASNTSSISITALAAQLQHPERMAGMHFFNPPQAMKLVEVITGLATDNAVIDSLMTSAKQWGKSPVRTKSTPGFIVNRVARPFYAEALRILQDGISDCRDIDETLCAGAGFRMGPFALMDLIGHDVNYAVTESVFNAYYQDARFKPSVIQKELVSGGFLGRKSGRGFYRYDQDLPAPNYYPAGEKPTELVVVGNPVGASELIALCEKNDIPTKTIAGDNSDFFQLEDTCLSLTDGRTATEQGAINGNNNWVVMDLVGSFENCSAITVAKSDKAGDSALQKVADLFQAVGKQLIVVDDSPALVAMRTVCMLANEAADTVKEGVCDAASVDLAMKLGTNYPQGPLEWAQSIGLNHVLVVLENLYRWYGEDRYRVSSLLRRLVISGESFDV